MWSHIFSAIIYDARFEYQDMINKHLIRSIKLSCKCIKIIIIIIIIMIIKMAANPDTNQKAKHSLSV